jgi:hypothetical protein
MELSDCCVVQEGEEAWLLAGHLQSRAEQGWGGGRGEEEAGAAEAEADVPAEELADADSRWVDCGGLRVHYKLALPLVSRRHNPAWNCCSQGLLDGGYGLGV